MLKSREIPTFRGGTEVLIFHTEVLNERAAMAYELMKHFAVGAAKVDGEDGSGRQKFRLLTPAELAKRACDIAEDAFKEFQKRDWLVTTPEPKPPRSTEPVE